MSAKFRPIQRICLIVIAAGLIGAAASADYKETRELALDAADLSRIEVIAGPGTLDIRGVDGLQRIEARADIVVRRVSESRGADYVSKAVVFDLKKQGHGARLVADHKNFVGRRDYPTQVNLLVRVPPALALSVDDDSGDLEIQHMTAGLRLTDDSGDARISDIRGGADIDDDSGEVWISNIAGGVRIDDDSGTLEVNSVEGSVDIRDDSGHLAVRNVRGTVKINDDSGNVSVTDITGDVSIEDDSGTIEVTAIQGNVIIRDDSGGIRVSDVSGDLDIPDADSGEVRVSDIRGATRINKS
jgi:hypothetical protein